MAKDSKDNNGGTQQGRSTRGSSTGIPRERVGEILKDLPKGVKLQDRKNWHKVHTEEHGDSGPRIYIAKQAGTRRVEVSNWADATTQLEGFVAPDRENGKVVAILDFASEQDPKKLEQLLVKAIKQLPKAKPLPAKATAAAGQAGAEGGKARGKSAPGASATT